VINTDLLLLSIERLIIESARELVLKTVEKPNFEL
jgi:hypothetical protein